MQANEPLILVQRERANNSPYPQTQHRADAL